MSTPLSSADLRFIHRVIARRRGEDEPTDELSAPQGNEAATPHRRAAELAVAVLAAGPPSGRLQQAALMALFCQLRLEGYELMAPQGVIAGMITDLGTGRSDVARLTAWLEDRAIKI